MKVVLVSGSIFDCATHLMTSGHATGSMNLAVTLAVVAYFGFYTQQLNLAWIYTDFVPLLSAAVLFSFALSACLYAASFRRGALLAKGGNTGARCTACWASPAYLHQVQRSTGELKVVQFYPPYGALCLTGCPLVSRFNTEEGPIEEHKFVVHRCAWNNARHHLEL